MPAHDRKVAMTLPVHPFTKLTAIGVRRDGRPIWPVYGGSQPVGEPPTVPPGDPAPPNPAPPPAPPGPPAGDPPRPDDPLGPGGLKALHEEREARKALEKKLAGLAPLEKLAAALGSDGGGAGDGKTDFDRLSERLASHETELANERTARFRAEVAHAKGLTPDQASWLQGATREEMTAAADKLLAAFPGGGTAGGGAGLPAPDPSQGAHGGGQNVDLDAQIFEAQKAGDVKKVLRLQNQKLRSRK